MEGWKSYFDFLNRLNRLNRLSSQPHQRQGQVLHSQAPAQVAAPLKLEHLAPIRAHVRARERDHLRQARRALPVLETLQVPVLA